MDTSEKQIDSAKGCERGSADVEKKAGLLHPASHGGLKE